MCHTSYVTHHTSQAIHKIQPFTTPHTHTAHPTRLITEDLFSEQNVAGQYRTDDSWRKHERAAVALVQAAGDDASFGAWENKMGEVSEMGWTLLVLAYASTCQPDGRSVGPQRCD